MYTKMTLSSINPFFFRRIPETDQIFISNQISEWSILHSETEFSQLCNADLSSERTARLLSQGFLNSCEAERQHFERAAETLLTKKFSSKLGKPSLVMVVPTLRCDHSCAYCQVSRAALSSTKHELGLSAEATAHTIDSIAAQRFKLEFQGGEPLLRQDFLMETVSKLRELRGDQFDVVIATALGPDLDDSFVDWLRREKVGLSVSYDGVPEAHAKIRKSSLFDSYERLRSQLNRLRAEGVELSFVATFTSETLKHSPSEIIDSCRDLGIQRLYSRPVEPYGFAGLTISKLGSPEEKMFEFLEEYLEAIIATNDSGFDFWDYGFGLYLSQLYRSEFGAHVDLQSPAGYALSACILNYDGVVYGSDESRMLVERLGAEAPNLKIIEANEPTKILNEEAHEDILASSFSECSPHCEQCAYQPFCGSDPIHHLYTQGDFVGFKTDSTFCRYSMFMFDLLVRKISGGKITPGLVQKWMG